MSRRARSISSWQLARDEGDKKNKGFINEFKKVVIATRRSRSVCSE